jgi:hypothetical protein
VNRLPTQEDLEQTLEWARAHSDQWQVRDRRGVQLRSIFARATETFAAATNLTAEGFARQAIMLSRPLFEDMVLACWVKWIADPDWVFERLTRQHQYSELLWRQLSEKHPSLEPPAPEDEPSPVDWDRYEAMFGTHGEKSWWAVPEIREVPNPQPGQKRLRATGRQRSLLTLIKELEEATAPQSSKLTIVSSPSRPPRELIERLRYLFDIVNRVNNQILHHTSYGYIFAYDHDDKAWNEGSTDDLLPLARSTLLMTYDKLIFVMCKHGNEAVEKSYVEHRSRIYPLA